MRAQARTSTILMVLLASPRSDYHVRDIIDCLVLGRGAEKKKHVVGARDWMTAALEPLA